MTYHTSANPDRGPCRNLVEFLEKHNNPAILRYTEFFMVEFGGVEQVETVDAELERNKCDMIGVCRIDGILCCAFATLVKRPITLHGVGQNNGYYIFKNIGNGPHMTDVVVNLIHA